MAGHTGTSSDKEVAHDHASSLVLSALTDEDAMTRRLALGSADRLGLLDINRLRTALADPAEQVTRRGIELAARSPHGPELWSELVELLNNDAHCEVAAFALGELELSHDAMAVATTALSHQATTHSDPLARESAVAALGALGVGLDAVLAATTDVATVRRRAVLALAAFDDSRAEEALSAALTDRDWQVRQAAEDLVDI